MKHYLISKSILQLSLLVPILFFSTASRSLSQTYKLYGAGTSGVNGIYVQDGSDDGYPAYKQISGGTHWVHVWDTWWTVTESPVNAYPSYYYFEQTTSQGQTTFPISKPSVEDAAWQWNVDTTDPDDGGASPGPESFQNTTANMTFADGSSYIPPVGSPGTSNNPMGRFQLTGSAEGGVLQALTISVGGTLTGVSNVKLWSSTDNSFSSGSDTQLGSPQPATSTITFSSFNSLVDNSSGTYYFVTIDIAGGSSGDIMSIIPNQNSFTFAGANNPSSFSEASLSDDFIALPVQLINFSFNKVYETVELRWETATEVNNYGFDVERKVEDNEWSKIAFIGGYGNSNSPKYYEFIDEDAPATQLEYRLKQIDTDGSFEYYGTTVKINNSTTDVKEERFTTEFALNQNYPNPFNPSTTIRYSIPNKAVIASGAKQSNKIATSPHVTLKIYDILGREIAMLVNENQKPGNYEVKFDASNLTSGIYFYKIHSGSFVESRKMQLIK